MKKLLLNDRFILALILLNAITIVLQGYELKSISEEAFKYVDALFTILFSLEAIAKITNSSWKNYIMDGWNKLDFILVILTLPSVITVFLPNSDLGLGYLLVFRVLRVLKIIRFFKFVPNIEHLFLGIKNALRSSIVIFVGFFVYVFVVGVLSNALFTEAAPHLFGTPTKSFYTVFKLFTVEGWYEIPEVIAEQYSEFKGWLVRLYFILILFVGGIFGLSIVNSVFVEGMINNSDMDKKIDRILERLEDIEKTKK